MIHKRITKHRFVAKNTKSIPVDRHILLPGHNFDRHFKLTIIEEITNQNMTKEKNKGRTNAPRRFLDIEAGHITTEWFQRGSKLPPLT